MVRLHRISATRYLIEAGKRKVGHLDCTEHKGELTVLDVYVGDSHRRQRVATAALESLLRQHPGCRTVITRPVMASNVPAQKLFLSLGFELRSQGRRRVRAVLRR